MNKRSDWNSTLRLLTILLGGVVATGSVLLSFYVKFGAVVPPRNLHAFEATYLWIFFGYIVIHLLFGTYIFYNKSKLDLLYYTVLGQLGLSVYMMALSYAGSWLSFPRSVILVNFIIGTCVVYLFNLAAYLFYHKVRGQKKIMVVGESQPALEAVKNFSSMKNSRHSVSYVVLSNYYERIKALSDAVDIVYLTGRIEEKERLKIYEYLMKENKKLFISTNFENLMMVNPNIMNFEDESIIEVSSFYIPAEEAFMKRLVDILISLFLLLLSSPIMLITAILIKTDSAGPILYKQERITYDNRPFNILKFRSMTDKAESDSGPVLAASNDARITRIGRIIRSTRIDELPQLINVLRGDMSLVGPRPERPYFVEQFAKENPYYRLRHHVRAGITGYAQVYGKYSTDFNSKLNFDLLYIKNYSLAFDAKLLFQTIKILFDKVSSRGLESQPERPEQWSDYAKDIRILY